MWSLKEIPHNWYTTFEHTTNPIILATYENEVHTHLETQQLPVTRRALPSGMRYCVIDRLPVFQRNLLLPSSGQKTFYHADRDILLICMYMYP
jgi:hypothetical protein